MRGALWTVGRSEPESSGGADRESVYAIVSDFERMPEHFPKVARARINYTYFVTVRRRWLKPLYAWLVSTFALPYWKRSFVDPLELLVRDSRRG